MYYKGNCVKCGAPIYYNEDEDCLVFTSDDYSCLCELDEDDEDRLVYAGNTTVYDSQGSKWLV